jgi:putative DNA primase/helicase
MSSNYDDVVNQLLNFGLVVKRLEIGKMARCAVTDDREKRGWYILHEVTLSCGDKVLVGSFGIWFGNENNPQKIILNKIDLTAEQKAVIKQRLADDRKRAINEQKKRNEAAAIRADKAWRTFAVDGDCEYLHRKGIAAHGVRFTPKGSLAIPLLDVSGVIHGLQFILDKIKQKDLIDKRNGKDKVFWPTAKKEHFHLIGSPTNLLLIAEGYATAASLHEATGFAVAVAFDANNLQSVAVALKRRYGVNILICADDDALDHCKQCNKAININLSALCPECHNLHGKRNTGAEESELAALAVGGRVITPRFADQAARLDFYARNQGKHTDFNDLQLLEGLHTVRLQVENAINQFGWTLGAKTRAFTQKGGGDDDGALKPIDTTDELLERFSLVYGKKGTVFDHFPARVVRYARRLYVTRNPPPLAGITYPQHRAC